VSQITNSMKVLGKLQKWPDVMYKFLL